MVAIVSSPPSQARRSFADSQGTPNTSSHRLYSGLRKQKRSHSGKGQRVGIPTRNSGIRIGVRIGTQTSARRPKSSISAVHAPITYVAIVDLGAHRIGDQITRIHCNRSKEPKLQRELALLYVTATPSIHWTYGARCVIC